MCNELSINSLLTAGNSYAENWCAECDTALKNGHACPLESKAVKSSEKKKIYYPLFKAESNSSIIDRIGSLQYSLQGLELWSETKHGWRKYIDFL